MTQWCSGCTSFERPSGQRANEPFTLPNIRLDCSAPRAADLGAGDYRALTEDRLPPPSLSSIDRLRLGPLEAAIERLLDHPRLFELQFLHDRAAVLAGLAHYGRPIQYAHVPEPLGALGCLDEDCRQSGRLRGPIGRFRARLADASSVASARRRLCDGDACCWRFPRPAIPRSTRAFPSTSHTASLSARLRRSHSRSAAASGSLLSARASCARSRQQPTPMAPCAPGMALREGRIARGTRLRAVDAVLTGVHQPGESHFELLRAFAGDALLAKASAALAAYRYRTHEFGDSVLINRPADSVA